MKMLWLSVILILSTKGLFAQNMNAGARITAMGQTGVALQEVWSIQSNQAGLASLHKPIAAISYLSSIQGTEISTQSIVFAYPYRHQTFGWSMQSFGFSAYKERRFGFAYACNFNDVLYASLNFNYHQLSIAGYGNAGTYSLEAGLQFKPSENLIIGAHVVNPSASSYDTSVDDVLPVFAEAGSSYMFSDKVLISTALVVSSKRIADFRTGLEYSVIPQLAFRGGISTRPFKQYAGFGYAIDHLCIDGAISSHPALGYSPQISLAYEF
ncbi:PorV/PorQ family protein [Arcticibacter eurypsychrophilus]|uniref:hypothetical protein n=1 Tax=Arcticibacter eurypsychrophilus TaxID=1434752 RepID=UPI001112CC3D|nr:hypothetical protein [Arcticibacter eurypsychrophilus]